MLEEFDDNEFLHDFYRDPAQWSLPAQLWFLADRQKQLITLRRPLRRPIVADYSTREGLVFGELLLHGRELHLFKMLHNLFASTTISPDLTVYVDATNEVLLRRIRSRGRPYELTIDHRYLERLRELYRKVPPICQGATICIDTSLLDINSSAQVDGIQNAIVSALL